MGKSMQLLTPVEYPTKLSSVLSGAGALSSPEIGRSQLRVNSSGGGLVVHRSIHLQLPSAVPAFWCFQQHRPSDSLSLGFRSTGRRAKKTAKCQAAFATGVVTAYSDPELRSVLRLASDTDLLDLSKILYGKSFLSPLLKSLTPGDGSREDYDWQPPKSPAERDALMVRLEARFLFLAADAKATLSGRRPSYRGTLMQVRKKLKVPCPEGLSTEDMESEIFLHLLQEYSRKSTQSSEGSTPAISTAAQKEKRRGPRLPAVMALRSKQLMAAVMKGGGAVTVSTLQRMVFKKLSGKLLLETARYQLAKEAVLKTGQLAAMLESRVAVLAAKQGLIGAAKRYVTLRSAMMVLGPMMWGTFLADILISAVGTDYARVVRAIYAFAQIRLLRGDTWGSSTSYSG